MVLVVRNDLKMGKGKIAAQCRWEMGSGFADQPQCCPPSCCRHVSGSSELGNMSAAGGGQHCGWSANLFPWEMCAQPKVVLKVETEEDMLVLQERAKSLNLPNHITIDAGKTQIAPNSSAGDGYSWTE